MTSPVASTLASVVAGAASYWVGYWLGLRHGRKGRVGGAIHITNQTLANDPAFVSAIETAVRNAFQADQRRA